MAHGGDLVVKSRRSRGRGQPGSDLAVEGGREGWGCVVVGSRQLLSPGHTLLVTTHTRTNSTAISGHDRDRNTF